MNIEAVLHDVRKASSRLALLDEKQINEILLAVADAACLLYTSPSPRDTR